jgi:hypothetical protein
MSRNNNLIKISHESFVCQDCGCAVAPLSSGGNNRNHCPYCLHSKHLDVCPGDRKSACRGLMEPIAVWVQKNGEWSIVHRCNQCGFIRTNRIAGDDNDGRLFALAARPITALPFPALKTLELLGGEVAR